MPGASSYVLSVLSDSPRAFYKMQEAGNGAVDAINGLDLLNVTGSPIYREQGPFITDYSIRLSGGASFNRASAISSLTNNFSFKCWIQVLSLPNTYHSVWAIAGAPAINGWNVFLMANQHFRVGMSRVGDTSDSTNVLQPTCAGSSWHHLAVVRDSGTWKFYQAGVLDNANAGNLTPLVPSLQTQIGDPSAQPWDGRFAYLAYYESVLSAERVSAHYLAACSYATSFDFELHG